MNDSREYNCVQWEGKQRSTINGNIVALCNKAALTIKALHKLKYPVGLLKGHPIEKPIIKPNRVWIAWSPRRQRLEIVEERIGLVINAAAAANTLGAGDLLAPVAILEGSLLIDAELCHCTADLVAPTF